MKIIYIIALLCISFTNAQVIIGDAVGTAVNKTSVLLEFAANQNKGIIVPYVRTIPSGTTLQGGTIVLDASTPGTNARMKYYNGSAWIDLSGQDANLTTVLSAQPSIVSAPELPISKTIIGDSVTAADGVLVLESTTKAMVLPTVLDVQNIPSPSPGMMVYVNQPGSKRLAVYNGSKWSFWKP